MPGGTRSKEPKDSTAKGGMAPKDSRTGKGSGEHGRGNQDKAIQGSGDGSEEDDSESGLWFGEAQASRMKKLLGNSQSNEPRTPSKSDKDPGMAAGENISSLRKDFSSCSLLESDLNHDSVEDLLSNLQMPSDSAFVEVPDPVKAMLQGASAAVATFNGTLAQMDILEDNIGKMHQEEHRRHVVELDYLVALSLVSESRVVDDDPGHKLHNVTHIS